MFFKNLALYRLTGPATMTPEEVGDALAAFAFKPCGGLEPFSYGWEPPLGRHGSALTHAALGRTLVCARKEARLLPPTVIRETLDARIGDIEEREFRTIHRKERQRLRDEVIFDLLPRAFTQSARTFAYLSPEDGWLVVDAATSQRAEELAVLLGQSIPGLDFIPYLPDTAPSAEMTKWLRNGTLPAGLSLLDECELRDAEGALARCQRQDLTADEIRAHLRAHKEVRRLGLGFEERLTFALTAEMQLKRIKFEGVEELEDLGEADEAARFDADFAFMAAALAPLLNRLLQLFGEAGS